MNIGSVVLKLVAKKQTSGKREPHSSVMDDGIAFGSICQTISGRSFELWISRW